MRRKHTTNVMRDLGSRINRLIDQVESSWNDTLQCYANYAERDISKSDAHDLIMLSAEAGAINPSDVLRVKDEYINPRHEDFRPENAWSLFNASTEVLKRVPSQLQRKSIILHDVYNKYIAN